MIDTKDYGLEAIDANGQVTHFPSMKAAVAAGFDRRHIEACLRGERESHALRRWRVGTYLSAVPGFVAEYLTAEPNEFEINVCHIFGKYEGWLWMAGLRIGGVLTQTVEDAVRRILGHGTLYWRSEAHKKYAGLKTWEPPPDPPMTELPVYPPCVNRAPAAVG